MDGEARKVSTLVYSLSFERCEDIDLNGTDQIRSVPTLSKRKKLVTRILNDLLREKPECTNTVYALLTYATQKWARDTRMMIGLDAERSHQIEDSFMEAVDTLGDLYRKSGIPPRIEDTRLIRISESDEILACVEEGVEWLEKTPVIGESLSKVIKAVHYMDSREKDVSPYILKEYYRSAVLYLYDEIGSEIDGLVNELTSCQWLYDGNRNSAAYHNTMLLIKIYPFLIHRYKRRSRKDLSDASIQKDANGLFLLKILEEAVNNVRCYNRDGEELYRILNMMLTSKTDSEIKKELGLTSSSLGEQKARAINLLSFLLWGYSTVEILEGMVFVPISKKDMKKII